MKIKMLLSSIVIVVAIVTTCCTLRHESSSQKNTTQDDEQKMSLEEAYAMPREQLTREEANFLDCRLGIDPENLPDGFRIKLPPIPPDTLKKILLPESVKNEAIKRIQRKISSGNIINESFCANPPEISIWEAVFWANQSHSRATFFRDGKWIEYRYNAFDDDDCYIFLWSGHFEGIPREGIVIERKTRRYADWSYDAKSLK